MSPVQPSGDAAAGRGGIASGIEFSTFGKAVIFLVRCTTCLMPASVGRKSAAHSASNAAADDFRPQAVHMVGQHGPGIDATLSRGAGEGLSAARRVRVYARLACQYVLRSTR